MKASHCRISLLGGICRIGTSGILFECGPDALLVDFGRSADGQMADFEPVLGAAAKLRAILLTHAHEDHVGGLPSLATLIGNLALYGTRETRVLATERHPSLAASFVGELVPGETIGFGVFRVTVFPVPHSVPGACAFLLESPAGSVLVSGDFCLDGMAAGRTPFPPRADLVFLDCTGAQHPGRAVDEALVRRTLVEIFKSEQGDIHATCFSSNLGRLDAFLEAAAATGRPVFLEGPAMRTACAAAARLGWPRFSTAFPDRSRRETDARALFLLSGSQGEPGSAADLVSREEGAIGPDAAVIVSASPVPGNETSWRALLNRFAARTDRLYLAPAHPVHASGHASREELAAVMAQLECQWLIPVHADPWLRSLALAHAGRNGFSPGQVLLPLEGDRLELRDGRLVQGAARTVKLPDDGDAARQERRRLAEDGVAFLCVSRSQETLGRVSITVRGFFRVDHHAALLEDFADRLSGVLEDRIRSGSLPNRELRLILQQEGQRLFRERFDRCPWILAQVIEME